MSTNNSPSLSKETLRYFGSSRDEIRPAGEASRGAAEAKKYLHEFCALTQPQQRHLVPYLAHMGFRKPFFSANWRSAMITRTLLHDENPNMRRETLSKVLLALVSPAWLAQHQEPLVLSHRLELSNHRLQIFRCMQMICDQVIEREGQFRLSAVPFAATDKQNNILLDDLVRVLEAAAAQTDVEAAKRLFSAWKKRNPGLSYPGESDQLLQPTMFTAAELGIPHGNTLASFGAMLVVMRMCCRFMTLAESSLDRSRGSDFSLALQISQKWLPIRACFNSFRTAAATHSTSAALKCLLGDSNTEG